MKKERAIEIGILAVIFVLAVIVFSYLTNRGSADMTADMGGATLPTLSFEVEGKTVNPLVGHKREMEAVAMRDSIAVYTGEEALLMQVQRYDNDIRALRYEVLTLDGEKTLLSKEIQEVKDTVKLKIGDKLKKGQEAILKITLDLGEKPIYYYTRVARDKNYYVKECLTYIDVLHNNLIKKENDSDVKKVMEANEKGDNTTFGHVTIHSDLNHVMWGNLSPKVLEEIQYELKEVRGAYTSVLLSYRVQCAGDNNEKEIYQVQEFFKVAYKSEQIYLLEYDRKMEEVFNTSNVVLSAKGVVLGIANEELLYKINEKGTSVAFVQANELWSYNKEEDAFSLIFSFADSEKQDMRNYTDSHSIQILSMENNGNMTFSVCGYMNRGIHEGESGIAVYYYNMNQNVVEEAVFIPSTQSKLVIEEEISELAYYNEKQGALYVMVGDALFKISEKSNKPEILMEGLEGGKYVSSADGHLFAYQKDSEGAAVVEIWDFAKDTKKTIASTDGVMVVPLGFVGDDFVYGLSNSENVGTDVAGNVVQAMHSLEIRNSKNEVIKTYQKENMYILSAKFEGNQIALKQGTKNGNVYTDIQEDYITNNKGTANEYISFKSYWTDLKETQYRMVFSEGIQDKKAKTLKPKQVLQEIPTELSFDEDSKGYYAVYGLGQQVGIFQDAGEAIEVAASVAGVVISPKQNYVWEDGNRVAWYRNFGVSGFTPGSGESSLAACIRKVLSYEKKSVDVSAELTSKSAETIIGEQLETEGIRFYDCSAEYMRYLMDKGVPIIGLKDATSAVLLIGYDARTVTYVEPSNGGIYASSFEKMNQMLSGSGRTFIGYIR